ncbi:MAG: SH3 domain-containing protein [Planctomycetes bacterium]|nr:SH3 domain-containing protein [Planctomycetota bacterium]
MNKWLKRLLPVLIIALAVVLGVATPAQGKEVYVAVQNGSAEGVIYDKPAFFGSEVVGFLESNQALEVLDESNKTFYQVKTSDGTTGWVARNVVRNEKLGGGDSTSSGGTGSSNKGLAAMGFSKEIEAEVAKDDTKFAENLKTVKELEYVVRGQLTGVWQQVEPMQESTWLNAEQAKQVTRGKRDAYSKFANNGGLAGSNP